MTDFSETRCCHPWFPNIVPIGTQALLSGTTFDLMGQILGDLKTLHVQLLFSGTRKHAL